MIEAKVQIAADLLPLFKHLWLGGVLSIGPINDEIHLEDKLFHETFPDVLTPFRQRTTGDWEYEKTVTIDGKDIRFFCLYEKEAWDDV